MAVFLARAGDRVGQEEEAAMNKSAKSKGEREAAGAGRLWPRLAGMARDALHYAVMMVTGLACVDEVLGVERA